MGILEPGVVFVGEDVGGKGVEDAGVLVAVKVVTAGYEVERR